MRRPEPTTCASGDRNVMTGAPSLTWYGTDIVRWLPATSVAVTVSAKLPGVVVESAMPFGVEPVHDATPEPPVSSAQLYCATTYCPTPYTEPPIGFWTVTVGAVWSADPSNTPGLSTVGYPAVVSHSSPMPSAS